MLDRGDNWATTWFAVLVKVTDASATDDVAAKSFEVYIEKVH